MWIYEALYPRLVLFHQTYVYACVCTSVYTGVYVLSVSPGVVCAVVGFFFSVRSSEAKEEGEERAKPRHQSVFHSQPAPLHVYRERERPGSPDAWRDGWTVIQDCVSVGIHVYVWVCLSLYGMFGIL